MTCDRADLLARAEAAEGAVAAVSGPSERDCHPYDEACREGAPCRNHGGIVGPSERDEVAEVLAEHRPGGLTTALNEAWVECSCDERVPVPVLHLSVSWENAYVAHEQHVSGALTDLLAERDRRVAAEALRGYRDALAANESALYWNRRQDFLYDIEDWANEIGSDR